VYFEIIVIAENKTPTQNEHFRMIAFLMWESNKLRGALLRTKPAVEVV
jgi:hypothetical protein